MEKGVFCLSIDTELLWGRKKNADRFVPAVKKARWVVQQLLRLFKKYQFPATWAIVGELFNQGDPLWHTPDVIKLIQNTPLQEIACHSFSHLDFSRASANQAELEIQKCLLMAKKNNIKLSSFVYPYNKINHLNILVKNGFLTYRGPAPNWFSRFPLVKKILEIIDFLLLLPPPATKPTPNPLGLINIPASMYYVSRRGCRRFLPISFRVKKAMLGIARASKQKKVFHLWLHEIDLSADTKEMICGLESIIKYASRLQKKNQLQIKNMKQIAADLKSDF